MKKIKIPKFKNVFRFIFLVLLTSVLILLVYISLPQTERIFSNQRYDLSLSDGDVWSKEFNVELKIDAKDLTKKWSQINETKNVIQNRLSKIGVSDISFNYQNADDTTGNLYITVKTDKSISSVEAIVQSQVAVKIMVKKDDVIFDDTKDPYGKYNPDNYNEASIRRNDFRTIYVSKLKTTSGDYAYFGIFKPWIWNNSKFYNFIAENSGKDGGIYLDGFVTPVQIPVYESGYSSYGNAKPVLSMGISSEKSTADLQNILYNSGEIPLSYTFKDSKIIETNKLSLDIIKYSVFLVGIFVLGYLLYSMFIQKLELSTIVNFGLTTIIFIDFLKLSQYKESAFVLTLLAIFTFAFSLIYENIKARKSLIILLLTLLAVFYFIKVGFLYSSVPVIISLTLTFALITEISQYYLKLFKSFVTK